MTRPVVLRIALASFLVVAFLTEPLIASAIVSSGPTSAFASVTPARLLDTRTGKPTIDGLFSGGGALGPGGTLDLTVDGRGGVPADATAVVLNVTATGSTAGSYLTVYPTGASQPTASNLNFTAGATVANLVTVGTGSGGKVTIFNKLGAVQVIADVTGFYTASGLQTVVGQLTPISGSARRDFATGASLLSAGAVGTLSAVTTTAPSAGTLDVQIDTTAYSVLPANNTATAETGVLEYAICTSAATLSTGCGEVQYMYTQKGPNNNISTNQTYPLTARILVPVSAGSVTVYLNGSAINYGGGLYQGVQVTATFTPSAPIAVGQTLGLTATP